MGVCDRTWRCPAGGLGEGTDVRFLRSFDFRKLALPGVAALCLVSAVAPRGHTAESGATLEERKLPMKFNWVACEAGCRGWVSAVGVVTADTPKDFDDFAQTRELTGATIVLDSS